MVSLTSWFICFDHQRVQNDFPFVLHVRGQHAAQHLAASGANDSLRIYARLIRFNKLVMINLYILMVDNY